MQDYNQQVIRTYTLLNVLVNGLHDFDIDTDSCDEKLQHFISKYLSNFVYLYGDWSDVCQELVQDQVKFQLIVTSETIYSEANYSKLLAIFTRCLAQPDGQVLVASKSHYFGVGGGTFMFIDFVENNQTTLKQDGDYTSQFKLSCTDTQEVEAPLLRHVALFKWVMK